jgi:Domain of unknown function (DUF5134)
VAHSITWSARIISDHSVATMPPSPRGPRRCDRRHCQDRSGAPGEARDDSVSHGLSHYLIPLVMALAMLYMYLAVVPPRAGAGMAMTGPTGAGANFVGLPPVFVVILCTSAVWQVDALSRYTQSRRTLVAAGRGSDPGPADAPLGDPEAATALAPRLEMGCHIAMRITMAYMLVLML